MNPGDSSEASIHPRAVPAFLARCWIFMRDRWFSIDLRTLGLFRIVFGIFLIGGLLDHARDGNLTAFFSNQGVLSNHFALFAPIQPRCWSILFAFSEPGEVAFAFALILIVYVLYTVGWKTKLMQILVIVCHVSIINRNLLLQDGGAFVTTILAVWTVFLPLGARFSLDRRRLRPDPRRAIGPASAGRAAFVWTRPSTKDPPRRHVSFVCFALAVQLAVIYVLNAVNKTGSTWQDGSAVHYTLWLNRMNTGLAAYLRFHEPAWMSPFFTKATLVFELTAGVLALTPVLQTWARRALMIQMWLFHIGIASLLSIGPFPYVMITYSLLLLGRRDWDLLTALERRFGHLLDRTGLPGSLAQLARRGQQILDVRPSPGPGEGPRGVEIRRSSPPRPASRLRRPGRIAAEVLSVFLFIAMIPELTLANPCVPEHYRMRNRPQWMADMLYYLRVYQTWGMFSSDPPLEDGVVVVDAVLADGSHLDPLTGRTPDFDALTHGPWFLGHDWSEYMSYLPWERHRMHRNGLLQYVLRLHERREPSPGRKIQSAEIIWLSGALPPPGEHTHRNVRRQVLASYVVAGP